MFSLTKSLAGPSRRVSSSEWRRSDSKEQLARNTAFPVATCSLPTSASLSARLEERIPQTSAANAVSGRRSRLPRAPENNRGTSRTSEGRGRRTEERTRDRERKGDKADTCKGEAIIFARCQTKTGAAWAAPTDSAVQEEGGWGGQAYPSYTMAPRYERRRREETFCGHERARQLRSPNDGKAGKKRDASRRPPERER